jgi:hypothetical protein
MKRTLLTYLFFFCLFHASAQDSIRAVNIFKHRISNGKASAEKLISQQESYDLADRLVIKIHYYDSIPNIKTYTRYFYREKKLISAETYDISRNPLKVKRYFYDKSDRLTEKRLYEPQKGKLKNTITHRFKYSGDRKKEKLVLNARGKWIEKHSYSYRDSIKTTRVKYHKRNKTPLKEKNIQVHYKGDFVQSRSTLSKYLDGHTDSHEIRYSYNDDNLLTGEDWYLNGDLEKRITNSWFVNRTMNLKYTYNSEGELVKALSYRYIQRIIQVGEMEMLDLTKPLK